MRHFRSTVGLVALAVAFNTRGSRGSNDIVSAKHQIDRRLRYEERSGEGSHNNGKGEGTSRSSGKSDLSS